MTELASEVRTRAGYSCEYCLIPQAAFLRYFALRMQTGISTGITVEGLAPEGRATVYVLGINGEMRQMPRSGLVMK